VEHEAHVRPGSGELSQIVPFSRRFGACLWDVVVVVTMAEASSVNSAIRLPVGGCVMQAQTTSPTKHPQINSDRLLGWHQDRTIAVLTRIDVDGFGPWTCKKGVIHVAPPFSVLAGMVTLRAHLDPVSTTNAPLLIAPGSHRHGRIPEMDVPRVVRECGTLACLAQIGDIWLYATPILHASEAAVAPDRRRVLQVDFATGELPGGLQWRGV
jgi:hypothetical protein